MDTARRRWLVGRLVTQALYGQEVEVRAWRGAWVEVSLTGQPTPDHLSYPGWLPARQLVIGRLPRPPTLLARAHPHRLEILHLDHNAVAIVTKPTTWLRAHGERERRPSPPASELQHRLPVLGQGGAFTMVQMPTGASALIRSSAVTVPAPGPPPPPTGRERKRRRAVHGCALPVGRDLGFRF